jgi:hypothetical protein
MVAYRQSELVSATEISKQFGEYISKIKDGLLAKIGILKNNKLNAIGKRDKMDVYKKASERVN